MVQQFIPDPEIVRERFAEVEAACAAAAAAAGRDPADVRVLVATKYVAAEHLGALRDAGVRLIGENRAQDLVAKHELYGDAFDYHFIGHLQSRKTKLVLPIVSLIHSVGSMSVVQEIEARAASRHRRAARGQHRRRGEQERRAAAGRRRVSRGGGDLPQGPLRGPDVHAAAVRRPRRGAPVLRADARTGGNGFRQRGSGTYTFEQLSMGTSADYEVAVQEGATIVRVGSVLF